MLQSIPTDVTNSLSFDLGTVAIRITSNLTELTNDLNHLAGVINPTSTSGTQSGGDTGTVNTSTSVADPASPRTASGTVDPTALGPLIGDAAILGVDVAATPFRFASSLTSALSGVALDLGSGQIQFAEQDFTAGLRASFGFAEGRLSNDIANIEASLAQLAGPSSTTAGQGGSASSTIGSGTALARASAASASQPRPTDVSPRPVVSQPAPSSPGAEAVSANHQHITAHPGATGIAATDRAPASQEASSPGSRSANNSTPQSAETASKSNPAKPSPTKAANGTNSTNAATHAAPGPKHAAGPKHRKH